MNSEQDLVLGKGKYVLTIHWEQDALIITSIFILFGGKLGEV